MLKTTLLRQLIYFPGKTLLIALSLFIILPSYLQANEGIGQIQKNLEQSWTKEVLLSEEDIRIYLRYIEPIYLLRFDKAKLNDVIRETGWTEERFAYVSTKIATGLSQLLRPSDERNTTIPKFAAPSSAEMNIIRLYQDELAKAFEAVQARHSKENKSN